MLVSSVEIQKNICIYKCIYLVKIFKQIPRNNKEKRKRFAWKKKKKCSDAKNQKLFMPNASSIIRRNGTKLFLEAF